MDSRFLPRRDTIMSLSLGGKQKLKVTKSRCRGQQGDDSKAPVAKKRECYIPMPVSFCAIEIFFFFVILKRIVQYIKCLFLSAVQQNFYRQKCLHCNWHLLLFVLPGTSRNLMTAPSSLCCVTSLRQLKVLPPSEHLGKICKTNYQGEAWGSSWLVQLPWSMSEGKLLNVKSFIKLF